jgi:hypothetical protein
LGKRERRPVDGVPVAVGSKKEKGSEKKSKKSGHKK